MLFYHFATLWTLRKNGVLFFIVIHTYNVILLCDTFFLVSLYPAYNRENRQNLLLIHAVPSPLSV